MAIPIKAVLSVSAQGFNVALKGAGKVLGGFVALTKAATVALIGLTAGFTALVLRQSAVIDRIGKVAKVTGVAAETLQRFGFAAELAGVSTDQAQVALRRFSRRLGEAQKNTGELAPTLKRLGIDLRDSSGEFKTAEEVLFDLADAIQDTEGSSERLAIAFKAFDSEGAELVSVLAQGSDAMRALFDEADSLGAVLSGSAIRGVEAFNDEFNKLQTLIGGIANTFVAALAPALTKITEDLIDLLKEVADTNDGFENLGDFLKDKFLDGLARVVEVFAKLANVLISVANVIQDVAIGLGLIEGPDLDPELQKTRDLIEELNTLATVGLTGKPFDMIEKSLPILDQLGEDTSAFRKEFEEIEDSFNFFQKLNPFSGYQDALFDLATKIRAVGVEQRVIQEEAEGFKFKPFDVEELVNFILELKKVTPEIEKTVPPAEDLRTTFEKIKDFLKEGVVNLKAFQEEATNFADIFSKVADRLTSPMDRLRKTLEDGLVKSVELFEDSLTQAILTGKADFSALGDHIKQVLAKALVQRFITGPILSLFGLAGGGPAKAGTPYIVGEKGPELFVPDQSGMVIPNNQLQGTTGGMGAGGTVINISAVDTQSFQQAIARDPEFIFNVIRAGARRTPIG